MFYKVDKANLIKKFRVELVTFYSTFKNRIHTRCCKSFDKFLANKSALFHRRVVTQLRNL